MIIERVACFTGHRPKEIFQTNDFDNEKARKAATELLKVIEHLIVKEDVTHFISGGALGIDQLAFMCVHHLKKKYPHVKNILASPFEKQDKVWSDKDKKRYQNIKKAADKVIQVDTLSAYADSSVKIGEYSAKKMQLRNMFMVDRSKYVIAVYNGNEKGGTYNCVKYATKNKKEMIFLNPNNNFQKREK